MELQSIRNIYYQKDYLQNMKTFRLFATLLVIALCAGFTSCSDDDEDENPLVGVWSYTWGGGNKEIVTFKSDGKGTWESYDVYDDESNTESFSYTFDGSTKLVLDWGDDDPETYTVEISDNSLKLIEEGGHTETFIKQ